MGLLDDLVEEILLRVDVEDLTRYKIVCKSWYSLISSHRFAKAHLKQINNNNNNNNDSSRNKELGHVRVAMPTYWKFSNVKFPDQSPFIHNTLKVVGSSNGLLCLYSSPLGQLILINNPSTRELRKLPKPPLFTKNMWPMFFGFGYDSSTDDYKLVMGTSNPTTEIVETLFQVLSLKSNTWKLIGVFKYQIFYNRHGILFDGALHWLAFDYNPSPKKKKRVFLSFDLSREEFTVINPEPVDSHYAPVDSYVGIVEDQLCIFFGSLRGKDLPGNNNNNNIWVMRSCKGERFWEKLPNNYKMKYQVVHYMKSLEFSSSDNNRMSFFCDDSKCLSTAWFHLNSPLYVPSLVSPYAGRPSYTKNNETSVISWSLKGIGGEGQQVQASIRKWIAKASEERIREIEALYKREVGETMNFYFHEEGNREIKAIVTKTEGDTLCAPGVKNNIEKEINERTSRIINFHI